MVKNSVNTIEENDESKAGLSLLINGIAYAFVGCIPQLILY